VTWGEDKRVMEENLPAGTNREDSFDIAVRGYHRVQVQEYMARTNQLMATLEQHLAAARSDLLRVQAEADTAKAELERLRAEKPGAKPVHEEISSRLSQILKLAAEEAEQERATAEAEIATMRADNQDQAARELAEARREAEETVRVARETGERELGEARREADAALTSAKEEADRLRLASVRQTQELLDEAQRRASAVNEVSHQRLETLTATHGEAVMRLSQIRDVLADLLDRDNAAGSLASIVEAVVHPPKQPVADAPAAPTPVAAGAAVPAAEPAKQSSLTAVVDREDVPEATASPLAEEGEDALVDGSLADAELDEEDGQAEELEEAGYPAGASQAPIDLRERRARASGDQA
jgi:hypothetical protein